MLYNSAFHSFAHDDIHRNDNAHTVHLVNGEGSSGLKATPPSSSSWLQPTSHYLHTPVTNSQMTGV